MKKYALVLSILAVILLASGCRTVVVYDRPAPPPEQVEVISVRPCPAAVWVTGHWTWKGGRYGRYVWVPGHWRR